MKKWNKKNTVDFKIWIKKGTIINGAFIRDNSLQSILDNYSNVSVYFSAMDMNMFKAVGKLNVSKYEIGNTRSADISGENKDFLCIRGRIIQNAYEMVKDGRASLVPEFVFNRIFEVGRIPIAENMRLISVRFVRTPGKKNNFSL